MRAAVISVVLAGCLLLILPHIAAASSIKSVEPETAKAGDVLTASGEEIGKINVDAMYLTNGKEDLPVEVVEQTDKSIKFKIPAGAKPGRWALMIQTKGNQPMLIEQPVKVTVE